MNREPKISSLQEIGAHEGFQAEMAPQRPAYWGVDRDPARRPGVPMEREPAPFPNSQFPIERQQGKPSVPMHGRPNKQMPPVFGTAIPLHGLSGQVRKLAYSMPDHRPTHWLLKMAADRVDSMSYRARKLLPFALPVLAIALWARSSNRPERRVEFQPDPRLSYRGEDEIETVPLGGELGWSQ